MSDTIPQSPSEVEANVFSGPSSLSDAPEIPQVDASSAVPESVSAPQPEATPEATPEETPESEEAAPAAEPAAEEVAAEAANDLATTGRDREIQTETNIAGKSY